MMAKKYLSIQKLISITCALAILVTLCKITCVEAQTKTKYTVMVYMTGSDLESEGGAASDDLEEMMKIGSNSNVNIIVETGGSKKWYTKGISNKTNQRWLVNKNGLKLVKNNLGKRNMGETKTLQDFVTWSMKTYTADKYMLVFWNHGGGSINGAEFDELFDNDSLNLNEIQEALQNSYNSTKKKLELLGFDTCLMGNLETASMLSPFSKYLVASEEIEPGNGWDYTKVLSAIQKNPNIDGLQLGKVICDSYKAQCNLYQEGDGITISLVDLSKINNVIKNLEVLMSDASADIENNSNESAPAIAKARSKSEDYGNDSNSSTDMVDLMDFMKKLENIYPTETKNIESALSQAVKYKLNGKLKPDSSGLSIYFPHKDTKNIKSNVESYSNLEFSQAYRNFIKKYSDLKSSKKNEIVFTNNKPTEDPQTVGKEDDVLDVSIDKSDLENIDQAYSVIAKQDTSNPNKILVLGMDTDVNIDENTGELSSDFSGDWITLNGVPISLYLEDEGEDYAQYSIPAILNGNQVDIMAYMDFKKETFEIIGAWEGIDDETGKASRDIIKIKKGDEITPLYYYYYEDNDEEGYQQGEQIIVGNDLELGSTKLEDGTYLCGFYIVDVYGNEYYSDYNEVNIGNSEDASNTED